MESEGSILFGPSSVEPPEIANDWVSGLAMRRFDGVMASRLILG